MKTVWGLKTVRIHDGKNVMPHSAKLCKLRPEELFENRSIRLEK